MKLKQLNFMILNYDLANTKVEKCNEYKELC